MWSAEFYKFRIIRGLDYIFMKEENTRYRCYRVKKLSEFPKLIPIKRLTEKVY